ncbi:cytochrome b-c1 complex subunit 6, mitochondrial [[Candida] anglica]|uniref:Cytochrome b-c1 complex subunit 6, mitochondrial n=1 Tax=[Candida] anglica TaxID=148631 RepID=A0ABP0EDG7_9ASCO
MSFLRDLIEFALPVAYADEPKEDEVVEVSEETTPEAEEEEAEAEEEEEEEEEEEDEDEEDEDEIVDPMDTMREECQETAACKPYLHHMTECIERVTKEQEEEGYEHKEYKEDCVEEFFHLQHCINDCVAPKLFHKLK